jgi:hypothetical protein
MTTVQAIEIVESALSALRIPDGFGGRLEGIEAAGVVAKRLGERWDAVAHAFESGKITPNEYAIRACDMIYEFRKRRGAA